MAVSPMEKAAELTAFWNALQQDKTAVVSGVNTLKALKANLENKIAQMTASPEVFSQADIDQVQAGLTWMQNQVNNIFP